MRPSWQNSAFRTLPARAPDFTLKDSAGNDVKLSDFRGKMVLVNFWASWCDVCKAEKRSMVKLSSELGDDLVILSIASDDEWEKVDQSLRLALGNRGQPSEEPYGGAPFRLLIDPPNDKNLGTVAASWGLEKVPESFLIDPAGNIVMYIVNKRDWSAGVVETCVQSYLDQS
jgi:thiol-disulfide isomerase/thioredoxin